MKIGGMFAVSTRRAAAQCKLYRCLTLSFYRFCIPFHLNTDLFKYEIKCSPKVILKAPDWRESNPAKLVQFIIKIYLSFTLQKGLWIFHSEKLPWM